MTNQTEAIVEIATLIATNRRLNRRCQRAESESLKYKRKYDNISYIKYLYNNRRCWICKFLFGEVMYDRQPD